MDIMKQIKFFAVLAVISLVAVFSDNFAQAQTLTPDARGMIFARNSRGKVMPMNANQYHQRFKNNRGNGTRVAVVDFGADWCGWCRKLEPVMKQLAADYAGYVDFYKVDTEKNPGLSRELGFSGIPYILIFPKNGKPRAINGYADYNEIAAIIDQML